MDLPTSGNLPATKATARVRYFIANNFSYASLRTGYVILLSVVSAIAMYLLEEQRIPFIEFLFLTISSASNTGLSTIDTAKLKFSTQMVLFWTTISGGAALMTILPVILRRQYFRQGYFAQVRVFKGHHKETEYEALGLNNRFTLWIVFGTQAAGSLMLGAYMRFVPAKLKICEMNDINPWWFGAFHVITAYNNTGFGLLSDNMVQFQDDPFVLILLSMMIMTGNVAFPIVLRLVIALQYKLHRSNRALHFILKHPRKCSTHLFSSTHTFMLAGIIVSINVLLTVAFVLLDNKPGFSTPPPLRVYFLCGYFQGVSMRAAGFNVVDLWNIAPSMQFLYCVMMYVSSYPIISAIQSVSVDNNDDENDREVPPMTLVPPYESRNENLRNRKTRNSVVFVNENIGNPADEKAPTFGDDLRSTSHMIKASLLADSWLLLLAVFIICIAENRNIRDQCFLSPFNILFEISSAYGTVGASMGYPGTVVALSGTFSVTSKVVTMIAMVMGKNRGLPRTIDPTVDLPRIFNVTPGHGGDSPVTTVLRHLAQSVSSDSPSPSPLRSIDIPHNNEPPMLELALRSTTPAKRTSLEGATLEEALSRHSSHENVVASSSAYKLPTAISTHDSDSSGSSPQLHPMPLKSRSRTISRSLFALSPGSRSSRPQLRSSPINQASPSSTMPKPISLGKVHFNAPILHHSISRSQGTAPLTTPAHVRFSPLGPTTVTQTTIPRVTSPISKRRSSWPAPNATARQLTEQLITGKSNQLGLDHHHSAVINQFNFDSDDDFDGDAPKPVTPMTLLQSQHKPRIKFTNNNHTTNPNNVVPTISTATSSTSMHTTSTVLNDIGNDVPGLTARSAPNLEDGVDL